MYLTELQSSTLLKDECLKITWDHSLRDCTWDHFVRGRFVQGHFVRGHLFCILSCHIARENYENSNDHVSVLFFFSSCHPILLTLGGRPQSSERGSTADGALISYTAHKFERTAYRSLVLLHSKRTYRICLWDYFGVSF